MVPVFPPKVKVVLFVPVQTVPYPVIDPATETEFTVTDAVEELAEAQLPFVTTAL